MILIFKWGYGGTKEFLSRFSLETLFSECILNLFIKGQTCEKP